MKFFLPFASDLHAEKTYQTIRKFVEQQTFPVADARYFEIFDRTNGQELHARVGEPDPLSGEMVIAIFRAKDSSGPFLICTPSRGVAQGEPILARGDSRAVEFDREELPRDPGR
jgi:hypothetical protein